MRIWLPMLLLSCLPAWGQAWDDPVHFAPAQHQKLMQPDSCSLEELAEMLSTVSQVHGSGIFMGGYESDTRRCYRRLMEAGHAAIPWLLKVRETGAPAGRLYACMGLHRLGEREKAREGLIMLLACKEKVVHQSGCFVGTFEAAVLAQGLLDRPESDF